MSITTSSNYTIQKGDTLWNVAKNNLRTTTGAQQISGTQIINEMKRLAQANGCGDDYEKLAKQFNIGNSIKLDNQVSSTESTPKTANATSTHPVKKVKTPKQQLIDEINQLKSPKDRVIEYNKNFGKKHYAIVDKKTCTITLYDKDGNIVKDSNGRDMIFPVGVGKFKGDNLMSGYASENQKDKESGRYTAAGEFTLDELDPRVRSEDSFANYGENVMDLKGDNRGKDSAQMALHQVPAKIENSARTRALRNDKNADGTLKANRNTADNRMSYGCVNLLPEDFEALHEYLKEGNKVYVLPEEKGNNLTLEVQPDGTEKFVQDYHKDQERGMSAEKASEVTYDKETTSAPTFASATIGFAYKMYNWAHGILS